jgi:hypothetical protein
MKGIDELRFICENETGIVIGNIRSWCNLRDWIITQGNIWSGPKEVAMAPSVEEVGSI